MALLHPVIRVMDYKRLVNRGRLRVRGLIVLEEKLDGYLLVAYGGRVYTGSGRRAPQWLINALAQAGVGLDAAPPAHLLYIEVYGRCLSPGGFHRGDQRCYNAALVDVARLPAYAGIRDAPLLARTLSIRERMDIAERTGLVHPRYIVLDAEKSPSPGKLLEWLECFRGREGYVMKLYSEYGHRLPPDYGAKLRGLLEVKVKHSYRGIRGLGARGRLHSLMAVDDTSVDPWRRRSMQQCFSR
ncbi:MAG TPA: hypothetical protein EYH50_02875 [Pyrodictium delaneyi]|uniref:RNA ligase domain-containing protein n=1 Tax=Pyrodictium delaneyi TaxID=1273541 RepID=A0A833EB73_9CREN|nr:hypothetical protein [Pyrodictium delaneyi]